VKIKKSISIDSEDLLKYKKIGKGKLSWYYKYSLDKLQRIENLAESNKRFKIPINPDAVLEILRS